MTLEERIHELVDGYIEEELEKTDVVYDEPFNYGMIGEIII